MTSCSASGPLHHTPHQHSILTLVPSSACAAHAAEQPTSTPRAGQTAARTATADPSCMTRAMARSVDARRPHTPPRAGGPRRKRPKRPTVVTLQSPHAHLICPVVGLRPRRGVQTDATDAKIPHTHPPAHLHKGEHLAHREEAAHVDRDARERRRGRHGQAGQRRQQSDVACGRDAPGAGSGQPGGRVMLAAPQADAACGTAIASVIPQRTERAAQPPLHAALCQRRPDAQ